MQLLKGKKALVTGGTAGIGKEIALEFARQGADVVIFGTNAERASQVISELEKSRVFPEQVFFSFIVDVALTSSVKEAIEKVLATCGQVDVLVNNAGITRDGLLMKMSEADWDLVIDVNLKSVYNLCHLLVS